MAETSAPAQEGKPPDLRLQLRHLPLQLRDTLQLLPGCQNYLAEPHHQLDQPVTARPCSASRFMAPPA